MTPLARSLLALSAILAVATAQWQLRYSDSCANKKIGDPGRLNEHVVLTSVHGDCRDRPLVIQLEQYCNTGLRYCGEHVKACNSNGGVPPTVTVGDGTITPIFVYCNDQVNTDVVVHITEYCC